MADIVVVLLIAGYSAFLIYRMRSRKKKGGCSGCSCSSCSSCSGCSSEYVENLIRKAKEERNG